jgi:diguanylate cyclase (GGDEF)-like protein
MLKPGQFPTDRGVMAARAPRWPDGADRQLESARFGDAGEAMHAVTRLLGSATEMGAPGSVAGTLVHEARAFFRVDSAILLSVAEVERHTEVVAAEPPIAAGNGSRALSALPAVARLMSAREGTRVVLGDEASSLARALGLAGEMRSALLLPMRVRERIGHVLILARRTEQLELGAEDLGVARAFATAAGAGLAQLDLAAESAARHARQASLTRAARMLSESLDLNRVLVRICEEAARILDADYANVVLGNAAEGLRFEATYGLGAELIGARVETGEGLVGKVVEQGESMLTNDYQGLPRQVGLAPFDRVKSALAVPMFWDRELRGALAVGHFTPHLVTRDDLALLEAFADLAAAACRNASVHAGLMLAARTDSLTGCLNHAALHDTLRRELDRCRRTGHGFSLAILDLDHFKQVNERHGHLAGDELLRRVGRALRHSVRGYDLVGRYGGDEFAIVAVDADEHEAAEVAARAISGIKRAFGKLDYLDGEGGATAGVAEWQEGEGVTSLIERADRALRYGKQHGGRGSAVRSSGLPALFVPAAQARVEPGPEIDGDARVWLERAREQTAELRKRTRQLALAGTVAARVAALGDERAIVQAAVDEIQRAFQFALTAILRVRTDGYVESVAMRGVALRRLGVDRWAQPLESGLIGRCVRERRAVLSGDVRSEPDYRLVPGLAEVRSELATPIWVGGELWGAIDIEEVRADAFDDDDARLMQTIADQVGAALRAARVTQLAADRESSSARQSRSIATS